MRQFDQYPIYINFADRWEETRLRQAGQFAMKDDEMMVNWLNSTGDCTRSQKTKRRALRRVNLNIGYGLCD